MGRSSLIRLMQRFRDTSRAEAGPILTARRALLPAVGLVFVAICLPVVLQGAPLADDFRNCLGPESAGLGPHLATSANRLGAIRPARFLEIILTSAVCRRLPFGVAIAVPLVLAIAVALLLRRLLTELGAPSPWPDVGGATWLLQPMGTEAALWPAALHINLGLCLALIALLLHRRGRHALASVAGLGACLSVEQVILALPLAVWLTSPPERRRYAVTTTVAIIAAALCAFVLFPGSNPRLAVPLSERLTGLVAEPAFYAEFPAVGLGVHSIPLAVLWAFPLSLLILVGSAALGWRFVPSLLGRALPSGANRGSATATSALLLSLIVLVNLPVFLTVPHQGSPRVFTPTWLVLAAAVGAVGWRLPLSANRTTGAIAGVFLAGACLSLAFSVSVRLQSADFTVASSRQLAESVEDGDIVAVCDIRRTVVEPAPRGSFAIHELVYRFSASDALSFYTGDRARFRLGGELWDKGRCPNLREADFVTSFDDLLRAWRSTPPSSAGRGASS